MVYRHMQQKNRYINICTVILLHCSIDRDMGDLHVELLTLENLVPY
jgi:hypothetical protein